MVSSSTVTHTLNAFELFPSRGDSALRDSTDTPSASELLCNPPRLTQRPAGLMVKASVSGGDQLKILGSNPRLVVAFLLPALHSFLSCWEFVGSWEFLHGRNVETRL